MHIETKRLVIRSIMPDDEDEFAAMLEAGGLEDIFGDCSDYRCWIKDWIETAIRLSRNDNPEGSYLAYAVKCKRTGRLVGSVGCSHYDDLNLTGITYFTGQPFRDLGYADEAADAYTQYFLEHYRRSALYAVIRSDNKFSRKAAERAGYSLEREWSYQDIYDKEPQMYCLYKISAGILRSM